MAKRFLIVDTTTIVDPISPPSLLSASFLVLDEMLNPIAYKRWSIKKSGELSVRAGMIVFLNSRRDGGRFIVIGHNPRFDLEVLENFLPAWSVYTAERLIEIGVMAEVAKIKGQIPENVGTLLVCLEEHFNLHSSGHITSVFKVFKKLLALGQ